MILRYPTSALVVLAGPAASGKSTLAARLFRPTQILSSDALRAMVADDESDQEATEDAFGLLRHAVDRRLRRGLLTVVDATSLTARAREEALKLGRLHDVGVYLLVVSAPPEVCLERNAARERRVPDEVVHRHARELVQTMRSAPLEGFTRIDTVDGAAPGDVQVMYTPQPVHQPERGPFDLVGDVHGCFGELTELLGRLGYVRGEDRLWRHAQGRRPVLLGDIADRGPASHEVLRFAVEHVRARLALYVPGNHCRKLARHLRGERIRVTGGLDRTLEQLASLPAPEREALVKGFLSLYGSSPPYRILDDGRLVAVHAGVEARMIGRLSRRIREFCLYGDPTGELSEDGSPVRRDWARTYDGRALVVYGHMPSTDVRIVGNTVNVDQGCVFGGKLTAFRYPEREVVQVAAHETYCPGVIGAALAPPRAGGLEA